MELWRHLRAVGLLPGVVTLVVPATTIYLARAVNIGWGLSLPASWLPSLLGCLPHRPGAAPYVPVPDDLAVRVRRGSTLAPWDPPRNLMVRGIYRYVRNPMTSGVLFILLGEATLLGSLPLRVWFLIGFAVNGT